MRMNLHHSAMLSRVAPVLLALAAQPALAECPPGKETSALRAALHARLMNAQSEAEAARIARSIWRIWLVAPDAQAQDLLDRGIARRDSWDLEMSAALFDRLIAYCPDYAEGYNQRAFTRFLQRDYDGALEDLDSVLAANPSHFGALSAKAMALVQQGRPRRALKTLRQAVAVHPFLRERPMLADLDRDL